MKAPYEVGGSLFLNYFFPFFWVGRVLSKIRKKVRFGGEPEEAGPMKWSKRFQKSCKTTIFVAIFFLISEHCVESWKFCSRSFRALVLLNCPNSKLYEEAVGYCGKNAKVDTIWKLAIFIWKWMHILFSFFLFFSKNIFWVHIPFQKKYNCKI